MTLKNGYSRDPLDILLWRESQTCKGCIHKIRLWNIEVCATKNTKAVKRCNKYQEQACQ